MLDDVLQDVGYALSALRSSPGFAATAILSLALGIGANTAIFSLINAVILKPLPVSHPEQLVELGMKTEGAIWFTNPIWEQVRDRQDIFSGAFAYSPNRLNLAVGGEVRNASTSWVSGDFFRTLGVNPVLGRTITAADDKRANWWLWILARLKPGIGEQQALARLNTLAPQIFAATLPPNYPSEAQKYHLSRRFDLLPGANGYSNVRRDYKAALYTLMAG